MKIYSNRINKKNVVLLKNEKGAREASATVAVNNLPFKLMMKINWFHVISKWIYSEF